MTTLNLPVGYQRIMPYLIIKNATAFFSFMQAVFDATEKHRTMRDETKIAHAELQVGESTIMFADATEQFEVQTAGMFIYVPNADAAYNKALAAGATSIQDMSDREYGRTGGIKDSFGNVWWITTSIA